MEFNFFSKLGEFIRPKPTKQETPARPDMRAIAPLDLRDRWSGYPTAGLSPSSLSALIRNSDTGNMRNISELFEEMEEKDSHLCSVLQTRKLAIFGLDRSIMPYSTDDSPEGKESQELSEFIIHAIDRITNFDQSIFNIMDAVGKGFSISEINWVVENGKTLVDSIDWIHPKKITFSDSFEPQLITDKESWKGEPFPPWKTIYFVYKSRSGWDTRAGLLRVVALLFLVKNYGLKDWTVFNEIFGMPLRVGKYDPSASATDKDALYLAIKSLGADAAGIISKNTEIEFVQAVKSSSGDNPFLSLLQYCNNEMSKAVLGQTLSTDTAGATGTYSAGRVHATVRQDLLEADGLAVGDVFTKQLIYPLIGFNFGWEKAKRICPYIRFLTRKDSDKLVLSQVYRNIIDAGAPISLDHINEVFNLPEIGKKEKYVGGEKLVDPMKEVAQTVQNPLTGLPEPRPRLTAVVGGNKPPAPVEQTPGGAAVPAKSENISEEVVAAQFIARNPAKWEKPVILQQAKLDRIASDAIDQASAITRLALKPVEDKIKKCKTMDEVKQALTEYYGEIDVREMSGLLYGAMMLSYFEGYL
jgi:phage gp29-like protein